VKENFESIGSIQLQAGQHLYNAKHCSYGTHNDTQSNPEMCVQLWATSISYAGLPLGMHMLKCNSGIKIIMIWNNNLINLI
jgi:hypothetical protein